MNLKSAKESLNRTLTTAFDIYERRPGVYQLIVPICHEDGDMVDIYLQESPAGENYLRICDFGMALMRLSYTYDIQSSARKKIFNSILINNGVAENNGNLYLDTPVRMLQESIFQFAGCVQKICNMRYWSREVVRSVFYDDLKDYVTTALRRFSPAADLHPLPDYPVGVDWSLTHNKRNIYLFGVRGSDKAKNTAISLLEFQKANLLFISFVVHEDIDDLGKKERLYLTRNADKQYPCISDFKEQVTPDVLRIAGDAPPRVNGSVKALQ